MPRRIPRQWDPRFDRSRPRALPALPSKAPSSTAWVTLTLGQSIAPDRAAVDRDHRHPLRFEPHGVTTRGRELLLREHLANPREHQLTLFAAGELHSAKPDSRVVT